MTFRGFFLTVLIAGTFSVFACGADLNNAIKRGDADDAGYILKKNKSAAAEINKKGRYGKTSLHKAAEQGNAELIKVLLKYGASINATDIKGETPLHSLAWRENDEIFKFLIENKANPLATDIDGYTAGEVMNNLKARPSAITHKNNTETVNTVDDFYDYKTKLNELEGRAVGIEGFNVTIGRYVNKARGRYFEFDKDGGIVLHDDLKGDGQGTYAISSRKIHVDMKHKGDIELRIISEYMLKDRNGVKYCRIEE